MQVFSDGTAGLVGFNWGGAFGQIWSTGRAHHCYSYGDGEETCIIDGWIWAHKYEALDSGVGIEWTSPRSKETLSKAQKGTQGKAAGNMIRKVLGGWA